MQQLIDEFPGAEGRIGMFAGDLQIAAQADQALTKAEQLHGDVAVWA